MTICFVGIPHRHSNEYKRTSPKSARTNVTDPKEIEEKRTKYFVPTIQSGPCRHGRTCSQNPWCRRPADCADPGEGLEDLRTFLLTQVEKNELKGPFTSHQCAGDFLDDFCATLLHSNHTALSMCQKGTTPSCQDLVHAYLSSTSSNGHSSAGVRPPILNPGTDYNRPSAPRWSTLST